MCSGELDITLGLFGGWLGPDGGTRWWDPMLAQIFSCTNVQLHTSMLAQVAQILVAFSFDNDKIKAVQYLKKGITDPQNYTVIVQQFSFSSEKEKIHLLFQ